MKTHILALDLGRTTLGLAVSRSGMFVTPLNVVNFKRDDYLDCFNQLKEVVEKENIQTIVIGYPTYPSGDPCEMTPIVDNFVISYLKNNFSDLEISTMDERNSTVEASEMLSDNGKNKKKQKSVIDSAAAMIILERYLRSIGQI